MEIPKTVGRPKFWGHEAPFGGGPAPRTKTCQSTLPEVLYSGCLSLKQAFKFQIGFFFIEKNYFHIDIISGWMEKICQKCLDRFVIYVTTNQYKLPAIRSIFASIPLIGKVIT